VVAQAARRDRVDNTMTRDKRMTPQKAAQLVFREWCAENGLVVEAIAAADLVKRIEIAILSQRIHQPDDATMEKFRSRAKALGLLS
jgi:hypothetical protein